MTAIYELVEEYSDGTLAQVVGRYSDHDRARREATKANLMSHPVDVGDEWGPHYYVRNADA